VVQQKGIMKNFTSISLSALTAVAISATALPATAQQKLIPAQSEIAFTSKQMGVPVDGKFKKFDAQVSFDPKKPEAAKISFAIDLASVSLGTAETEAELFKPDWFSTKLFPQASFASTAVKTVGAGKFEVAGKLTIKGVSRDVLVPVVLTQSAGNTAAVGSFTMKRLDFKIGDGDWGDTSLVANDVQVKFKLNLSGVSGL
jgi:polyisoprenoid-binding protein YceI